MKRALSLLIAFAVLFNCFAVLIWADESASTVEETSAADESARLEDRAELSDENRGEITSCLYDISKKTINISGTVNHDIMVTHKNYKIALYAIPIGAEVEQVITDSESVPLASTAISLRFSFVVNVDLGVERFYRYAVVIYNDDGDVKLIDNAVYASVKSDYSYKSGDKTGYKGIKTELVSSASDTSCGTVILPVYLDKLLSNTSAGYLYSLQGSYIYFDKDYIGELDARVRSLYVTGSDVYLQFLINPNSESGISVLGTSEGIAYDIPNMSIPQTINLLSAFTEFLCDRYDTPSSGKLAGIIVGDAIDLSYTTALSMADYAANYVLYMAVVGNVSRAYISDLDVVVPFSDNDSYSKYPLPSWKCSPSELLENICGTIDEFFIHDFSFSTLIKSEAMPYGISDEIIKSGKFSTDSYDEINADNAEIYSDYLDILATRYDNTPSSFIFLWSVPEQVSGNVLSTAYSYSYFKLLSNKKIRAFVTSFENAENKGDLSQFPELFKIVKYIDTAESFSITAPQLKLLGKGNWYSVVGNMYEGRFDVRQRLSFRELSGIPESIIGSYTYFDFSYYTDISSWFGGVGCDSLKIDYSDVSGRSLNAHFVGNRGLVTEYSELYCAYDYSENFVFTPYVLTKFSIANDNRAEDALYEVKLIYASDDTVSEISKVCRAYEDIELMLDISAFNSLSMADYIKISVRCLSGDDGGYSLSLLSITGYSTKYLSEELSSLIADERLRIRNENERVDTEGDELNNVFVIAGAVVMVTVIGIGIFMCFRREEDE